MKQAAAFAAAAPVVFCCSCQRFKRVQALIAGVPHLLVDSITSHATRTPR